MLLTEEEISKASYERNKLFGEDAALAYTIKPDSHKCVAKAQLKKVAESPEFNEGIARELVRIVKLMSPMKAATFSAYKRQAGKIQSLLKEVE